MVKIQKIIVLLLLCAIVSSFFGCDSVNKHNELRCVEKRLGISLTSALLVDSYTDRGYDGSICFHAFSVNDELEAELEKTLTNGVIPSEAKAICEASSQVNGEAMYAFPIEDQGFYYYDYFNDGRNSRICYALLDTSNDILYYFFASGQAIQYPDRR